MFSRIRSSVCRGIDGVEVFVETDIARGLPGINIVGLASTMVMESRERIKSAIVNSGLDYPRGRITVNLTPASIRKNGSCLDLPIAVGILTSQLYIDAGKVSEYGLIGELSLEGGVLGVDGALPMIICMKNAGLRKIIIPAQNVLEASLISGVEIYPVETLNECISVINNGNVKEICKLAENTPDVAQGSSVNKSDGNSPETYMTDNVNENHDYVADTDTDIGEAIDTDRYMAQRRRALCERAREEIAVRRMQSEEDIGDFAEICGQENAKRALTIAVTGRHGILMVGSPGCGKTMLASRLPSIMPPMNETELIETAVIYSAAGWTNIGGDIPLVRPFRDPHSTIGRAGLIGGGLVPVPGEITLAHNGVLFMDEVCEFDGATIEALRTPIEEKRIVHFRKGESYQFPCDFQLVMAANPCPCGYFGDSRKMCKCTEAQLEKYRKKLSGPMMDRIDMRISMEKVEYEQLKGRNTKSRVSDLQMMEISKTHANGYGEATLTEPEDIKKRNTDTDTDNDKGYEKNAVKMNVTNASTAEMRSAVMQGLDFAREHGRNGFNAGLTDTEIEKFCALERKEEAFMKRAYDALKMSPRSYKKTLKVARTIADISCAVNIREEHLAEALSYRLVEAVNE